MLKRTVVLKSAVMLSGAKHLPSSIAILMLSIAIQPCWANEDDHQVEHSLILRRETVKPASAYLNMGYYRMTSNDKTLGGFQVDGGMRYAKSDRFGFGPRIKQAYSSKDNFATLFTAMSLEFTYAVTGVLSSRDTSVRANNWDVVDYQSYTSGGFRTSLLLNQYFINTTTSAVPFSGFGLALEYELPSSRFFTVKFGVGADRVSNSLRYIVPIQAYCGLVTMI